MRTYAGLLKTKKEPIKIPVGNKNGVIGIRITKEIEGEEVEGAEVKKALLGDVNPEEKGWKVAGFRKGRKSVFVDVTSKEHARELVESVELRERGFKVAEIKKRDPWVVVKDVPEEMEKPVFIKKIKNQLEPAGEVKVEVRAWKKSDKGKREVILEVSAASRKALLDKRRISLGWVSCRVTDCVTLQQCAKCFGFGHRAAWCKAPLHCLKCGGEGHFSSACQAREMKCGNCGSKGHNSLDKQCPTFRFMLKKWAGKIDYAAN